MKVILGETFQKHFVNFPKQDRIKIFAFIEHIERQGFDGLQGRNKASHNVPKDHPTWAVQVKHALDNNLWHYHIGIPQYELSSQGDYTSEYVLHYILGDDFIKIVAMSPHPPMILPTDLS